jgi:hypothetical protein
MTRDEFQAAVIAVLDEPRTAPDRLDTIMRAADNYLGSLIGSWRPPVHLMTARLTLVCGHDGNEPSSAVLAEVTCGPCKAGAPCT